MFPVFLCRHLLHVHDCWTVYVEALSEETPRHQRQCLHRLRLPGCGHLLLCARSGTYIYHNDHMIRQAWVMFKICRNACRNVLMSVMILFAGIWERKHSFLDRFLSDAHSGDSPSQHTALLHGQMEAGWELTHKLYILFCSFNLFSSAF